MRCILLLAFLAAPKIADACSCASLGTIRMVPGPREPAPTNTHILLEVPLTEFLAARNLKLEDLQVTLRGPKGAVAIETARWGEADVRWIEIVPKALLAPTTRYSVHISVGGKDSLLGQIVTGEGPDQAPPAFEGVTKAAIVAEKASPGRCTTGQPYLALTVGEAKDDATPPAALRFHVWRADELGEVDFAKPPVATVAARGGELLLGHPSICSAASFVLPDRKSFKLGVKAVDLAGNASAPSLVDVSAPPPAKGRRADVGKPGGEDK